MHSKLGIVIAILLLLLPQCPYVRLQCTYRMPKPEQIVTGIETDPLPSGVRLQRSTNNNLRIYFHYTETFTTYPQSDIIVEKILKPAKHSLEAILRVRNPNTGILRVDRKCINGEYTLTNKGTKGCTLGCEADTKCVDVSIPDIYLKKCKTIRNSGEVIYSGSEGAGKAFVDIVIIVTFASCPDTTHASATSCFSENQLDRPILGIIELCRGSIEAGRNILESIKIVQHEIIHALGFAVDKYAFFRYSNGEPIVPRNSFGLPMLGIHPTENCYMWNDKIIKEVRRERESIQGSYIKTVNALVLENVVKIAREHFGCPTIDAVDLEDHGDGGSVLTHFDEYFLHNEMMTPLTNDGIDVLSKFTLALLKDTGWYDVDYTKAENLDYGKGKGCILPLEGCFRYMENQRRRYSVDF